MTERRDKKGLAIPLVIVTVVAVVILGLIIALSQRTCDLDGGDHSEGLYLRIETDKSVYNRGEDVVLSIFFVNEEDIDFSHTHSGSRTWELVVFDAEDREVLNSDGWPDDTGIWTLEVPANTTKALELNFSWDQTYDPWSSEDQPVPPGCYLLRFNLDWKEEIFGEVKIQIG